MINRTDFTRGFALLQDRWERQLGEPTIAEYHRILNQELSTDEFNTAVQIIFRRDTFWPSPQRFIEAVRGDPRAASEEAWNELLTAAVKGGTPTPAALATLRALGVTFRDVSTASEYQLGQISKRFRAHHERSSNSTAEQLVLEESPAELEFVK